MTRQVLAQWQVAVNLVGGDVVVTDVVLPAGLDQGEGPLDVGLDERRRVDQGVVVVTLSSVVNNRIGLADQLVHQVGVTDIADDQLHLVLRQTGDVGRVTGVGQLVEDGDVFNLGVVIDQEVNEVGADEAAAPGDDDVLEYFLHGRPP